MESSNIMISLQKRLLALSAKKETNLKQNFEDKRQQDPTHKNSISICYMPIQKLVPKIKQIFQQSFQFLISITMNNCDLRTFQNFPKLNSLINLNVSKNSLRGSFQFLVKNRSLKYLDVSSNMISDMKKFQPLKCLRNLNLYVKDNPFQLKTNEQPGYQSKNKIVEQFKNLGINYMERSINDNIVKLQEKKEQKQRAHNSQLNSSEYSKVIRNNKNSRMAKRYFNEPFIQEPNFERQRFSSRQSQEHQNIIQNLNHIRNRQQIRSPIQQNLPVLRRERNIERRNQGFQIQLNDSDDYNNILEMEDFQNLIQNDDEDQDQQNLLFQRMQSRRLIQMRRQQQRQIIQQFSGLSEDSDSEEQQQQQQEQNA